MIAAKRKIKVKVRSYRMLVQSLLGIVPRDYRIRSVKSFAYDLTIPLTEAYQRCHHVSNLRAVRSICHKDRNRKNRTEGQHRIETLEAR